METSLILLVIVEIGVVKYKMSRQVCKRTNTLIKEEHSNSGAMRHATESCRTLSKYLPGTCTRYR